MQINLIECVRIHNVSATDRYLLRFIFCVVFLHAAHRAPVNIHNNSTANHFNYSQVEQKLNCVSHVFGFSSEKKTSE